MINYGCLQFKGGMIISYNDALAALQEVYRERTAEGTALSENYSFGSYDRWSMAIQELSRTRSSSEKVLDIGALDGIMCGALKKLGYSVAAVDRSQPMDDSIWKRYCIEWRQCHLEADPGPLLDDYFAAIYMGQVLEHFTCSPRKPFEEIKRILAPGGVLVVDVPNVGELHNHHRLLRGKNILYDYKINYIDEKPYFYKGLPSFEQHNRKFTRNELRIFAEMSGLEVVQVAYLRSHRHGKQGWKMFKIPLTALRGLIPLFRKSPMPHCNESLLQLLFPARFPRKKSEYNKPVEIDSCIGACLMVRKKAGDEIGSIDKDYFFFFEETDWAYRMKQAGWKIFLVPSAKIFHIQGQTVGHDIDSRIMFYRSRYIYFNKWHRNSYLLIRCIIFARLLVNTIVNLAGTIATLGMHSGIRRNLKSIHQKATVTFCYQMIFYCSNEFNRTVVNSNKGNR